VAIQDAGGTLQGPRLEPRQLKVAVVIPSYRVTGHVLDVIGRIGPEVEHIYVVDDCCPDHSGDLVEEKCRDPRVRVLRNPRNLGVGGAVKTGYRQALLDGADVVVKVDGDGQMPPESIPAFLKPLRQGLADYAKGNRFYNMEDVHAMPGVRLFGNGVLSFMTKLSAGYWRIFDPTNGYTAIHRAALSLLPLDKVADGYFFETDLLFRLATVRAVVIDVPMRAIYADETSALRISRILLRFVRGHLVNFGKRIVYNYFLRDFSIASLELVLGVLMLAFSGIFGGWKWITNYEARAETPAGTVMLAALPAILGVQFLLSFLSADIASEPSIPLQNVRD
jgi:glycosyltransferase involved in cell wall biosynthesis